jgi:7-keto-8-aminopelargonate synthetase-like enzyme
MAEWVGKEAALVFSTGMQTNLGTISVLVSCDDVVFLDKQDHASFVDGSLGLKKHTYPVRMLFFDLLRSIIIKLTIY